MIQPSTSPFANSNRYGTVHGLFGRRALVGGLLTGLCACGGSNEGLFSDNESGESPTVLGRSAGANSPATGPLGPAPERLNAGSLLGYNMDYPGEWTSLPPFIDQMKNTGAFRGECERECEPVVHLDLDDAGWPKSLRFKDDPSQSYDQFSKAVITADYRADIGERFVVTWEGEGAVGIGEEVLQGDASQKRQTFVLGPETYFLYITSTDPNETGDYVRNVRVFREDHEALLNEGEVFNPEMIDYLSPFKSLRFMDWMQSNVAGLCSGGENHGGECYRDVYEECGAGACVMPGSWEQRPTNEKASWLDRGQYLDPQQPERGTKVGGYALEPMIALANRVGADPHFNMPAVFDDEYVVNFAQTVLETLDPSLTASVEYSNEVWNFQFPQADYANQLGQRVLPGEGSAYVQFMASRTNHMCKLWKEVFAGQEERLRCLISPQTGFPAIAETVLECPDWARESGEGGNCYSAVDGVNIAGYFSGCLASDETAAVMSWIAEEGMEGARDLAFEQLEHGGLIEIDEDKCDNGTLDQAIENYSFFGRLAAERDLELYVYESGTHFEYSTEREGYEPEVEQLLLSMTRDERMREAYVRNFEAFQQAGGGVFNVWGWVAPNDLWSNVQSVADREHPKYQAILDFVQR